MTNSPQKFSEEELLAAQQYARADLLAFAMWNKKDYIPAWFHEVIAEKLMAVERGEIKRLMIFMPPRHGKSELASIMFPTWYLGLHPDREVVATSYNAELAQIFGYQVRDLVTGRPFQALHGDLLREDSQSKSRMITKEGGSYSAIGVGGALTGRGADCLIAGTMVCTSRGQVAIENLASCSSSVKILGYDTEKRAFSWKSIQAFKSRPTDGLFRITTASGRVVTATGNHPLFVEGKGYVEARSLAAGDSLLRLVWEGDRENGIRGYEERKASEKYQLPSVFLSLWLFLHRCEKTLSSLWKTDCQENAEVLRERMPTERTWTLPNKKNNEDTLLSAVQQLLSAVRLPKRLLSPLLQFSLFQLRSLSANERESEPEMEARCNTASSTAALSESLSNNAATHTLKRPSFLCKMRRWLSPFGGSSSEQLANGQHGFEPRDTLFPLSQEVAFGMGFKTEEDTVARVDRIREETTVYDIQVEGTHNFFANGILSSNCLLIDDPIKGREQADSKIVRDLTWNWFSSTAYTRLYKESAVIIVLTRWHLDDLAGRLLDKMERGGEQWEIVDFPAIALQDELINGKLRRTEGEALWPEKFPIKRLEEIKEVLGTYDFNALYQQKPILSENQEFKPEWIQEKKWEEVKALRCRVFLTIDTAISKSDASDSTGLCLNFVDKDGNWYFKAWKVRCNSKQLIDLIFQLHEQYDIEKIGIEETAFTLAIKPFFDERCRQRQRYPYIVPLKHHNTQKETRIRGLLPRYDTKSIYHIDNSCRDLEEEMLQFPKGKHDDVLDAAAYQIQIAATRVEEPQEAKAYVFEPERF